MNERFEANENKAQHVPGNEEMPGRSLSTHREGMLSTDIDRRGYDDGEEDQNILEYVHALWKHRWVIAGVTAIITALGLTGTLLMTPLYRASVTIQINRDVDRIVDIEGVEVEQTGNDFYQTQYALLQSRALAERVVQEENLGDETSLRYLAAPSIFTRINTLLLGEAASSSTPNMEQRPGVATAHVMSHLTVEPVRGSRLVRIHFDSQDPNLSQRVANAYAAAYISLNLERRYNSSTYARTFLEGRLAELKQALEDSEREMTAYARAQGIINVSENQSLVGFNLSALNSALTEAQAHRIETEGRWLQAQSTVGLGLLQILQNPTVQALRQQKAEMEGEYQRNLSVFRPAFPAMVQLQAQMEELTRQIESEVTNVKNSIRAEYAAAVAHEASLEEQVDGLTGDVLALNDRTIQYNILQREVDTNREIYDAILQRYNEIGVAGGVGTNNISVVDAAQVPGGPNSPNVTLNISIALLIGLAGGVMIAFAREWIDDTVKAPEDVQRMLGLSVLGIIPRPKKASASVIENLSDQRSPVAEAYRSLRTSLQFSTAKGVPNVLLVTSPRPGEGKSTTALALSINFAQLGMSVLLVDSDLRNPTLHRVLSTDNSAGLSNYLAGTAALTEVIQNTAVEGLVFLPSGPLPPNPAELLAGPKMLQMLSVSAARVDVIIIDAPPVMGLADAPILSSIAAGTLLVLEAARTRQAQARASVSRLRHSRAHLVGAVLTKFEAMHGGYGYSYHESYYGYGETPQITGKSASGEMARGIHSEERSHSPWFLPMLSQKSLHRAKTAVAALFGLSTLLLILGSLNALGLEPMNINPTQGFMVHFVAYAGLASMLAVTIKPRMLVVWAVVGLMALGAMLEVLQSFAGRDRDVFDIIANCAGAICGGVLGRVIVEPLRRRYALFSESSA